MLIQEITLYSKNIEKQLAFYEGQLGFHITDYPQKWSASFTMQIGKTKFTFLESPSEEQLELLRVYTSDFRKPANLYHFAFNIPENQIEAAKAWLETRNVSLLTHNEQSIYYFEDWNAHSIYFKDPAGNVLELVARHTLDNSSDQPFDVDSIQCVSEIGITVDDVAEAVERIGKWLELSVYKEKSDTFAALGDENGLLILVTYGRFWFPQTGVAASTNWQHICISQSYILKDQEAIKTALLKREVKGRIGRLPEESWDSAESFFLCNFNEPFWAFMRHLTSLIHILREAGYDKHIYADYYRFANTYEAFALLHYRDDGLIPNWFTSLSFNALRSGKIVVNYKKDLKIPSLTIWAFSISQQLTLDQPELTPELEGLLLRLLMQPIG